MTKQDLVAGAANAAGITKKAAGEVLDSMLDMITASLKKGDTVQRWMLAPHCIWHKGRWTNTRFMDIY